MSACKCSIVPSHQWQHCMRPAIPNQHYSLYILDGRQPAVCARHFLRRPDLTRVECEGARSCWSCCRSRRPRRTRRWRSSAPAAPPCASTAHSSPRKTAAGAGNLLIGHLTCLTAFASLHCGWLVHHKSPLNCIEHGAFKVSCDVQYHIVTQSAPPTVGRANNAPFACGRLHFRRLLFPWTDVSLGNCSYLDTCRHMHNCKFVHYELDSVPETGGKARQNRPPVPAYLQVQLLSAAWTVLHAQSGAYHSITADLTGVEALLVTTSYNSIIGITCAASFLHAGAAGAAVGQLRRAQLRHERPREVWRHHDGPCELLNSHKCSSFDDADDLLPMLASDVASILLALLFAATCLQ